MPLFQLPMLVTQFVNARVAIQRLQEFLSAPEQPPIPQLPPAQQGRALFLILGGGVSALTPWSCYKFRVQGAWSLLLSSLTPLSWLCVVGL